MAKIAGSVDARRRPVVRLDAGEDGILAIVDTGFNGDLMVTESSARLINLSAVRVASRVELGDGSSAQVFEAAGRIEWLGELRYARVMISAAWRAQPDDPTAMVGAGLLEPHLLLVDYGKSTVEIETQ